jgi:predicted amidohydrolase
MKITVCELPRDPVQLDAAWARLCVHTQAAQPGLLLLPAFAFAARAWEPARYDAAQWQQAAGDTDAWLARYAETGADNVAGARPVLVTGRPYVEGYVWSRRSGYRALRRRLFEPGADACQAHWFAPGDAAFPVFGADGLRFGLNVCTGLWALETHARCADGPLHAVLTPRVAAPHQDLLAAAALAAVRGGAFSVSSGPAEGEAGGWIIAPDGRPLALTSAQAPCATADIPLRSAPASSPAWRQA